MSPDAEVSGLVDAGDEGRLVEISLAQVWSSGVRPGPALGVSVQVFERTRARIAPSDTPVEEFGRCAVWRNGPTYYRPLDPPRVPFDDRATLRISVGSAAEVSVSPSAGGVLVYTIAPEQVPPAGTPIRLRVEIPGEGVLERELSTPSTIAVSRPDLEEFMGLGGGWLLRAFIEQDQEQVVSWSVNAEDRGMVRFALVGNTVSATGDGDATSILCDVPVVDAELRIPWRVFSTWFPNYSERGQLEMAFGLVNESSHEVREGVWTVSTRVQRSVHVVQFYAR